MANKWRDEDYNRYSDEEIRRFRARGYDQPRQYSQDFSSTSQYGNTSYGTENDSSSDREWQHRQREHLRRGVPEWENHSQPDDYAKPGTFYYGGAPQRRFGLRPGDTTYEDDATLDYTTYGQGSSYGSSYATDSARIDANFRDVAAYEREMSRDEDHPHRAQRARGRGMFHDDPNRGPIDRLRNWMNHRGKGPKGYTRSDERIREDVSDHLTQDYLVDATNIEVVVVDCECTLNGNVATRDEKRRAEDIAERIMGVKHVQNNLRVAPTATSALSTQDREGTMSTTVGTNPTLSASRNTGNY